MFRAAIHIDRCVCMRFPFTELLTQARTEAWGIAEVIRETGCGDECGLCRPYIRRMLVTGETVFHQVLEDTE
jgi:bacterioferritin-associated ferredoxin